MKNAQLRDNGSDGQSHDGAGIERSWPVERRRTRSSGDSPMDTLTRLPAWGVLERMPVPSLAVARDGTILFANTAFAEMVGYPQDRLAGAAFPEIFHSAPAEGAAPSGVDALADPVAAAPH